MFKTRQWAPSDFYLTLLIVPIVFFVVFFAWPIAQVVIRSFTEPELGLGNYARALGDSSVRYVFLMTFAISGIVTLVCLVIAYPLAFFISRQRGIMLAVMMGIVMIPLWTSVVIRSYAWMILFQRNGIINQLLVQASLFDKPVQILQTWTAVIVGMVHILLPFMVLPLINNMRNIDETILRAGRVLGARPVTLFIRVYLPLTGSGMKAGISLVFITALGFYVTPALLGGAKGTMAAVLIEQQASTFLDWPMASTLATILLASTVAVYGLYSAVSGNRGRSVV